MEVLWTVNWIRKTMTNASESELRTLGCDLLLGVAELMLMVTRPPGPQDSLLSKGQAEGSGRLGVKLAQVWQPDPNPGTSVPQRHPKPGLHSHP